MWYDTLQVHPCSNMDPALSFILDGAHTTLAQPIPFQGPLQEGGGQGLPFLKFNDLIERLKVFLAPQGGRV